MSTHSVPVALTIAGSDSSGGAGIQADLKTFAAFGVFGTSAIVALTAQNTTGVSAIHDVPADMVAAQIDAVFSDLPVAAVKTGMLSRPDIITVVVEALARWAPTHVVVDPVMIATSGARLISDDAIAHLRGELLPRASIVTPNLPEASVLCAAQPARTEAEMEAQARQLLRLGARAVLIKGGHGTGDHSVDLLVSADGVLRLAAPRIDTKNTHGTGCTLSSAIAAGLARGETLEAAVRGAKAYVQSAIIAAAGRELGQGHGPLEHFPHLRPFAAKS